MKHCERIQIKMNEQSLKDLLEEVSRGSVSIESAFGKLKELPFASVNGVGNIDNHRMLRQGFPEFIYAESKQAEEVVQLMERIYETTGSALATRVSNETAELVQDRFPESAYDERSKILSIGRLSQISETFLKISILTGGTSDRGVAEESALVSEFLGHQVERVYDVGVAGLHRLLGQQESFSNADVVIVIAGMDGALPSVVGGLVASPVIAVPTSVGYGSNLSGLAPLLTMLNSCASGIAVMNIDNGFGAAVAAQRIGNLMSQRGS
jgi:hypothetical protein